MTRGRVLAIGTELTQGQITNRNAAWISDRLTSLGISVLAHATVPDDRTLILAALDAAAADSDLLIVTGGLGPTTDDFTRDVIAEWAGLPLEFREASWTKIVRRLSERGIEVALSNRIQCFFPQGAEVLENDEGTADGFRLLRKTTEVVVLPGPPREGTHLWDKAVDGWLKKRFPVRAPVTLETWSCLGKSESALGEIVEAAVSGFGVQTGYRASMPYIEVKLWFPHGFAESRRAEAIASLDRALAPYAVARNGEDVGRRFFAALVRGVDPHAKIRFLDFGSSGRLAERLYGLLRGESGHSLRLRTEVVTRVSTADAPFFRASDLTANEDEWTFALYPDGEVAVAGPMGKFGRRLPNPYPSPALADRLGGYRGEMALLAFGELLDEARAENRN
ncbi:MAG: competence/damage-inducible protein A [Bdellovibrionales bacterium]|nr:competence/damage-inducible protein A [Bdellovibrionales bacterium]